MRITFCLTVNDVREGLKAHLVTEKKQPLVRPGTMGPPNGVFVVPPPVNNNRGLLRPLLGWVLIISLGLLVFLAAQNHKASSATAPGAPVSPSPPILWLTEAVPWLFLALVVWFFFVRQLRLGSSRPKDPVDDPFWQQERTLEVRDTGILVSAPTERHEFDWLAYQRVVETANLFLLYQYPLAFQIVPKRAFASPDDLNTFRQIIGERIGDRRTGAFPVEVSKR